MMSRCLLDIADLSVSYPGRAEPVLSGIDLTISAGEVLALVGESGSGKSTLARAVLGLAPVTAGTIKWAGSSLPRKPKARARMIQMVFQDSYGSLDPRWSVGASIAEPLAIHGQGNRAARQKRVVELATQVGIDPTALGRRPRDFSGGQRQRIAIARALALDPPLLILDEPLSALDVSVQAQIIELLMRLKAERGLAYLFVSHDLAVVEAIADRVAVIRAGRIVETADRDSLFDTPRADYTRQLLAAVPRLDRPRRQPFESPMR